MAVTGKTFQYAVELDGGGRLTIPGGGQFVPPEGWSADHLLLAAVVRCSVDSFAYHARRAGHEVAATGSAHGTIMKTVPTAATGSSRSACDSTCSSHRARPTRAT